MTFFPEGVIMTLSLRMFVLILNTFRNYTSVSHMNTGSSSCTTCPTFLQ